MVGDGGSAEGVVTKVPSEIVNVNTVCLYQMHPQIDTHTHTHAHTDV